MDLEDFYLPLSLQYLETAGVSALLLGGFLLRSLGCFPEQLQNAANLFKGRFAMILKLHKPLILSFQLCTSTKALLIFNSPKQCPWQTPRKKQLEMFACDSHLQEGVSSLTHCW